MKFFVVPQWWLHCEALILKKFTIKSIKSCILGFDARGALLTLVYFKLYAIKSWLRFCWLSTLIMCRRSRMWFLSQLEPNTSKIYCYWLCPWYVPRCLNRHPPPKKKTPTRDLRYFVLKAIFDFEGFRGSGRGFLSRAMAVLYMIILALSSASAES